MDQTREQVSAFFTPEATREIGGRYVYSLIRELRAAVTRTFTVSWPERRNITVGNTTWNVPTQIASELGGIVGRISPESKRIPRSFFPENILTSCPEGLAVLFTGDFLIPEEWEGIIGEVKEEPHVEREIVTTFRRIFEVAGQPDIFRGSGGQQYEFDPAAKSALANAIHQCLGSGIEQQYDAARIAAQLLDRYPELMELREEGRPVETLTAIVHYVLFE